MKNHRILLVIIAVITVLSTFVPWLQSLEYDALQFMSRFMPTQKKDSQVAIIAIDENSLKKVGPWPWNYDKVGQLVKNLRRAKIKSIGIMLPLSESQNYYSQIQEHPNLSKIATPDEPPYKPLLESLNFDDKLAVELKKSANVLLPVYFNRGQGAPVAKIPSPLNETLTPLAQSSAAKNELFNKVPFVFSFPEPRVSQIRPPLDVFQQAAAQLGFMSIPAAGRIPIVESLAVLVQEKRYPSFLLQMLAHTLKDEALLVPGVGIKLGDRVFITNAEYEVFPRPALNENGELNVSFVSASDVLNGQYAKSAFRGKKAAIIGVTSQAHTQLFNVYGDVVTSHATWIAHSLNAMLSDQMISNSVWSVGIQRAAIVLLAIYLLLLPAKLRGWVGFAITALVAVILINVSVLLLLLSNIWQPLVLPILFLLFGQLLITAHHKAYSAFKSLRTEAANAYRELGLNLQAQGRLDQAFNYMRKCSMDKKLLECLYNLGLEFERRRQFHQAVSVYDYIAKKDEGYKDIQDRRARHMSETNNSLLISSINPSTATLVIDHPNVARPVLGRYQVERILGQGAMGTVYLGSDPKIGRTVAIKTLPLSEEFEERQLDEVRGRFFREAETAGRLNHPNIVTIFDVGEEHDLAYIAMDFIKGEGLDVYSHPETLLSIEEVFYIGITVAEALDYAHAQGVVHRDIKPGNIIYERDSQSLKVTDFGIACVTDNTKTRTGTVLGSPSFMSPEQLSGDKVDGRSDIYSLGITLYQLFTGILPFMADSMASLAFKIANEKPKGIRKVRSDLPTCLTRIINKAVEKDPSLRYQTGTAFAEALRRCAKL
ncbi:protein kinase domain-containing protein [Kaarinaea lacus]